MKRVIDFDVSVAGLPARIIRIEYESHYASFEEIQSKPYSESRDVFPEAVAALEKELRHGDFEIQYWYWIE